MQCEFNRFFANSCALMGDGGRCKSCVLYCSLEEGGQREVCFCLEVNTRTFNTLVCMPE